MGIQQIRKEIMGKEREELESKKFWLGIEELTLLRENHNDFVKICANVDSITDKRVRQEVEMFILSLENLHYKLKEVI